MAKYQSDYTGAEIDAGINFTQLHNTDGLAHNDIRQQINNLGTDKADKLGADVIKIKQQYKSVISVNVTGVYNNGIKIKTKIPFSISTLHSSILVIQGNLIDNNVFIVLQFYKPANSLNAAYCKATSINNFTPEIKLANENGYLVIEFTAKTFNYASLNIDAFVSSQFIATYMKAWEVVNEELLLTAENVVTIKYTNNPDWITATLQNGWTGTLQYRRNQIGQLEIKGDITAGTITAETVVSTFQAGYRPTINAPLSAHDGNFTTSRTDCFVFAIDGRLLTYAPGASTLQSTSVLRINAILL